MRDGEWDEACQDPAARTGEQFWQFVPGELRQLENPQSAIPAIAKNPLLTRAIEDAVRSIPTSHRLLLRDARFLEELTPESVHLVVTSPPYWTLKRYRQAEGQLGHVPDYETFLAELDRVWEHCFRALVPGGRLICVVGDVCLSRRRNGGRHTVVPLHASIQEHCRRIGFDNLAPIIWYKIANAAYEVENGAAGFLGKPYEPNAVIKNDIEFILMQRKPGGYRKPPLPVRVLSVIAADRYQQWFQQVWTGLTGASTRLHPAPYPLELAERLIRMFSFVGDTVLDPFMGTGTTNLAAARWGRNSIGCEVDPQPDGRRMEVVAKLGRARFPSSIHAKKSAQGIASVCGTCFDVRVFGGSATASMRRPCALATSCLRGDVIAMGRRRLQRNATTAAHAATNVTPPPWCDCRAQRAPITPTPPRPSPNIWPSARRTVTARATAHLGPRRRTGQHRVMLCLTVHLCTNASCGYTGPMGDAWRLLQN